MTDANSPRMRCHRYRAANQLSEGVFEGGYSRGQRTPRSLEATRLHGAGRRVQTRSLDPRPLVELGLQPLGADRPVRHSMRQQHREGPATRPTEVALDTLLLLLVLGACRIGVTLVSSMTMHPPRRAAGTHRTQSSELIFAQLDGRTSPESLRPIKPLYFGLSVSTGTDLPLTAKPHSHPLLRSATRERAELKKECRERGSRDRVQF